MGLRAEHSVPDVHDGFHGHCSLFHLNTHACSNQIWILIRASTAKQTAELSIHPSRWNLDDPGQVELLRRSLIRWLVDS